MKDSTSFLDHINGRNRCVTFSVYLFCKLLIFADQKNLGMSMKVKKATVDDVKAKIAAKKQEQRKEKKFSYDYEEKIKDIQVIIQILYE